jgi:hypothetical protein
MRVITAVLALAAAAAAEPTVRTQRTVGNYTGDYYKGIDASKSGDALRQDLGALIVRACPRSLF